LEINDGPSGFGSFGPEDMQSVLEDAAKALGIGLSTYRRELAATRPDGRDGSASLRRASRAVGVYAASSPEGQDFYDQWVHANGK